MRHTSQETIKKIRQEYINGKSRYKIASELQLSVSNVYKYTKDLPKRGWRESCIRGRSLELLQQLLNDGYVYTEKNRMALRKLQKLLPIIKRSQFKSKSIFYLEEKNKLALQEMIKINKNKVIKYRDLTSLSKVFNVRLSRDDKYRFYGKKNNGKLPIIRRKDGGFLSSYHEDQKSLDDF